MSGEIDDLHAKREARRLDEIISGDSFDATPFDVLDIVRKRIEEGGANHLMVIWEPEEGGREIVHSKCTIATAVYMLDRAKNDIYARDEAEESHGD